MSGIYLTAIFVGLLWLWGEWTIGDDGSVAGLVLSFVLFAVGLGYFMCMAILGEICVSCYVY